MIKETDEEKLEEEYDMVKTLEVPQSNSYIQNSDSLVKMQPIYIEHGFDSKAGTGESVKLDFRGINKLKDIAVLLPEDSDLEVETFDPSVNEDGKGIMLFVKQDWVKNSKVKIFYNQASDIEIQMQEVTGMPVDIRLDGEDL